MKHLFISILFCALVLSGYGQNQRKSITDSVFQLEPANVLEHINKRVGLLGLDVPLRVLPLTVTRLSSETLERKNIYELQDAARFLPGVTVRDQLGAFYRFSVRGTNEAVIAVDGFRDERSLLNNVPFGDLSGVESIEVLKGAAAVLSGHSVMGGVINIVRKKPTADFTAGARITYGSWEDKSAAIDFGGKLAGPVTYRATARYANGEGYRHVGADRFSAMFSLASALGKTGNIEGTLSYSDDRYDTEIGSAPTQNYDIYDKDGNVFMPAGTRNPFADYHTIYNDFNNNMMKRTVWDVSLTYTQKLASFMNLRERFSWNHSDLDYASVEGMSYRTDTTDVFNGGYYYFDRKNNKYYIDLTDSLATGTPLCFSPDSRGWTNMLEITGDFHTGSVKHKYIFGFSYEYFNYTQYNGWGEGDVWGPGLNQLVSLNNPHLARNWWDYKYSEASIREWHTSGIYLHDVLNISKKWKVMGSARFDFYNYRTAKATVTDGTQHYDDANRAEWNKVKTSAFTGRAGLVFFPVEELSLYASIGSHFKPYNTMYDRDVIYLDRHGDVFDPSTDGGEVFKPEEGYQVEVGARYLLADLLDVNASLYYIRKNNVVKNLGTENVEEDGQLVEKTIQGQVGTADSRGFDLELTVRPLPSLQFTGGMGFQDYRIRKITVSKEYKDYTDASENERASGIPRTTFYIYGDYTVPRGILKDLSFHLSGTFRDKIYTDVAANVYYPSLFLMDCGIFYTIRQRVTLALNIDNLLDKEYFKSVTVYGKPRSFSATVSCRF